LRATGKWKVGCGEVYPVARLEYKWAAASVWILYLTILCNSEEGLGVVDGGGDILQKFVSGRGVRGWGF
jgi:hypothetical protein